MNMDLLVSVLARAVAQGATEADGYLVEDSAFSASVRLGDLETVTHARDARLSLRVFARRASAAASTSGLSRESLARVVDEATSLAKVTADAQARGARSAGRRRPHGRGACRQAARRPQGQDRRGAGRLRSGDGGEPPALARRGGEWPEPLPARVVPPRPSRDEDRGAGGDDRRRCADPRRPRLAPVRRRRAPDRAHGVGARGRPRVVPARHLQRPQARDGVDPPRRARREWRLGVHVEPDAPAGPRDAVGADRVRPAWAVRDGADRVRSQRRDGRLLARRGRFVDRERRTHVSGRGGHRGREPPRDVPGGGGNRRGPGAARPDRGADAHDRPDGGGGELETDGGLSAMIIDTHCHLDDPAFADLRETLRTALTHDVWGVIAVGCDAETNAHALAAAGAAPKSVWACLGFHPDWTQLTDEDLDLVAAQLAVHHSRIVGLGEVGQIG